MAQNLSRKLRVKLVAIPWSLEVPTLTMASLAAVTPERHAEVCIVDALRERLVVDEPTDLVGISASTPSINAAYALADEYRRRGVKVVIGGHHATAMPEEALAHADAVVCGEGETSWVRIVDAMLTRPTAVGGVYRDAPPDLAALPTPRTDLMRIERYARFFYPVIASRGCPQGCSFCFAKRMARGHRTFPLRHVIEQVRRRPPWVRCMYFVDDNLGGNPEYARELFRALRGVAVPFGMQVRPEFCLDPDDLRLAREAGCAFISTGFESLSQDSLDRTGKRTSAALYEEVVANVQREGIICSANWMFGFDWDTPDVFARTWDFLHRTGILHSTFTTEIPFPGTPAYRRYLAEGRILTTDYDAYVGKDSVVARPKQMSPEQLRDGVRWLVRTYYSLAHRRLLLREMARREQPYFPMFRRWERWLFGVLHLHQVLLWRMRVSPGVQPIRRALRRANKYRYMGDLFRGTNFWRRPCEPAGVPPPAAETATGAGGPFWDRATSTPPAGTAGRVRGERLEPSA